MRVAALAAADDFDGWRDAARSLAAQRVSPAEVVWQVGDLPTDLFGDEAIVAGDAPAPRVPRAFIDLARTVAMHADPERFALLYAMLTRLIDQPRLIDDKADPAMRRLEEMAKAVRRDIHKMRAFLRFCEVEEEGGTRFVAWFELEMLDRVGDIDSRPVAPRLRHRPVEPLPRRPDERRRATTTGQNQAFRL